MHRFFPSLLCVFILVSVFILSGSVLAIDEKKVDLQKRIGNIQKEMEDTRKKLEKDEKKLKSKKSEKHKVLGELNHTEKKLEAVNRNLWVIRKEEKYLKKEISNARKQYDRAVKSIREHSEKYSSTIRSMYKRQSVSVIEMLFSAGSVSSFLWRLRMLSALAAEDMRVLDEMRAYQDSVKVSMDKIKFALDAKMSLARSRQREEKYLTDTRKKRKIFLGEIENDLKLQEERVRKWLSDLENSEKKIEEYRKKIAEQMKRKKIPDDLKGYNFASRKGKLPWPVSGKVVSSFGSVVDKRTKTRTINRGIEILTSHGEPVRSIGKGKVAMTNFIRGYGNFIIVYHPNDFYSVYGHLSDILVNSEDIVSEGTVIGSAGSTGLMNDSEALLKLEVLNGASPENPLSWLRPDKRRAGK